MDKENYQGKTLPFTLEGAGTLKRFRTLPEMPHGRKTDVKLQMDEWSLIRKDMLTLLSKEQYGYLPAPCAINARAVREDAGAFGGKAVLKRVLLTLEGPLDSHTFSIDLITPAKNTPKAVFINIAFMEEQKDGIYVCPACPIEEIIDGGFAIAIYSYTSVASDDDNFTAGLAKCFPHDDAASFGKLGMWAYSMSRVADYLLSMPAFSDVPLAAIGFSRLGKTALWCGANDERFTYIFPFGSSTAGVQMTRENRRQNITEVQDHHYFWFCGNFKKYHDDADKLPFDQHFAVACCAPRKLLSSVSIDDEWLDLENENASLMLASQVYERLGMTPYDAKDKTVTTLPNRLWSGLPALSLRPGTHFFSRADWKEAMDFINSHN